MASDADSIDRDMAARRKKTKGKRVEIGLESDDEDRKSSKSKRKGKVESESDEPEERPDLADLEDEEGDALVYRAGQSRSSLCPLHDLPAVAGADAQPFPFPCCRRRRPVRPEKVDLGWTAAPCGRCPAFDICSPSGPINPDGCTYYSTWLEQNFG